MPNLANEYEFELYRVRLEKPSQPELFQRFQDRAEVLRESVISKPTIELRQTVKWHVGNVRIDNYDYLYFLIGKTSLKRQEYFDEDSKDFMLTVSEDSPFTICLLNPVSGILAISKRSKLAPKTQTVASRLKKALEASTVIFESGYTVVIRDISDPFGFIQRIKSAYAVKRFKFWVSPSNPIDIDQRYHQPNKNLVDNSGAKEGQVTVSGDKLDKSVITEVASSVNAVGDDASATIQPKQGSKTTSIRLKSFPYKTVVSAEDIDSGNAGSKIDEAYARVRNPTEE